MDVALSLKKMGLDVTMLVMEGPYDMPIPEGERDEALEEGVRIENRWGVTAIRAGQDGLTCTMQRCLAVFDHNGAFAPELDPLCTAERSADMVVLAIGQGLDPVDGLPQTARHLLDADPQTGRLAGGTRCSPQATARPAPRPWWRPWPPAAASPAVSPASCAKNIRWL